MGSFQFTVALRTDVNQKRNPLIFFNMREFQFTRPRPNKIMHLAFFVVLLSESRAYM